MEGTIRSTNTSPTSDLEAQDKEVNIPSIKPQAGIEQADTQKKTLQLEYLETEGTGIKNVHTAEDQNTGPTDERTAPDLTVAK